MNTPLKNCLQLIRDVVRQTHAYQVADAGGMIKLDAMENPYCLPEELKIQLQARLAGAELNRYPDPTAAALRKRLMQVMEVPQGKSIVLGNGSDELIQMLAMAVADHDMDNVCLMSFEPGFVMYRIIADFVGINYIGVPLAGDFSVDMKSARQAIAQNRPAIIFIAYPNNPSANCFRESDIEEIISMAPGMVVLDEAYNPFAQKSFMHRLVDFDNLLVMRTVSKMGLAGLRLGLLCGHPDIINEIDKIRLPYNINVLTQIAADLVLDNADVLERQAVSIREQRGGLLAAMQNIPGLEVLPSEANFILFRVLDHQGSESKHFDSDPMPADANAVFESIKQSGVLIKNMKADAGPLKNCLRVTVGTPEENVAFLSALKKAMNRAQKGNE